MAVKVAFLQNSSCWGCHQSLLNAHLALLQVLPELEIVYWPAVVDFKMESLKARKDGEIVVGFIEGGIRTEGDKENTLLLRKKCQLIVSFGTCATYGGVFGMANLWTKDELLSKKFLEAPSLGVKKIPNEHVPPMLDRLYTVPETIKVDVKLTGCPPATSNIVDAVLYLLGKNPDYHPPHLSVCDECKRTKDNKVLKEIKRDYEGMPDPGICLINQGYICMGSATKSGCGCQCPNANAPCLGCYGPTENVKDHGAKLLATMTSICSLTPEEIMEKIPDPAGLFNRFTLAASTLKERVKDHK